MGVEVCAGEAVTMQSAASLQQILSSALGSEDEVALDCAGLSAIDLSFVHVIEAARRRARESNKILMLSRPANPCVAALLLRAGFLDRPSAEDVDFWFHGDLPK